ncbi:DUF2249 domain-containing protein [Tessaracoccus sp. SD287]|uniref:DUF2249 domain-containing protein n=1 Tax=Tessaracoccus sp. SD287 TaxID=2782008 RepID=UPI001A975623|nr:DUF2249 domain-containing protein [Tessaracoccus sp. SD287]MBO1030461.1 DUF2249 domain-containing protein [Tessaracoccus sp. SD287]
MTTESLKNPLTITEKHACGCGDHDQDLPELDARAIPHAIRHGAILGALGQLGAGGAMILAAPHDPQPLLRQIDQQFNGTVEISYVEQGPEVWRLKMVRG